MVSCAKLTPTRYHALGGKLGAIQQAYATLQKDREYARSVTLATSDKASLQGRIHKVSTLLKTFP